ncbi:hypothetical protein ASZ78_007405 [Callipepla squamata]|uniref:Nidogen-1 n=1 Tax=Callipepla squamata TaxID=9009 RepID=A0A226MVQ0_CALSU|nr:hypothetical protein ASZ78_007405 [Callipepla squamata]
MGGGLGCPPCALLALALPLALPAELLLPHGAERGDAALEPGDDARSAALELSTALRFYGAAVRSLYVATNGIIAVNEPKNEEKYLGQFPVSFGAIAPFMADLDTTDGRGSVYYREDTSSDVLQLASDYIKGGFPETAFDPSAVVIVTWKLVAPYQGSGEDFTSEEKRNTFQAVLASSDSSSYAIFLYPEDGLQFCSTYSKNNDGKIPAMVGFSQASTNYYFWENPGSYNVVANDEDSIRNLHKSSNAGRQGVWVFEIGSSSDTIVPAKVSNVLASLEPSEEDQELTSKPFMSDYGSTEIRPQYITSSTDSTEEDQHVTYSVPQLAVEDFITSYQDVTGTPSTESFYRHRDFPTAKAPPRQFPAQQFPPQEPQVIDVEEFDETGIGSPQRVNGKVKGRIFVGNNPVPVTFENTDLHSYVVMNHGRAYTAISTIPEALGYSLLPLASIGGIIGWMFAVEQQGYKNGFSITGGEFTRQTEVTFLGNNEKLVIKQKFSGIDEHGHLTISTEMEGRIPEVPPGSSVHIEPYTELYHASSSVITSSSTREYTVTEPERDGVASTYTGAYQWRQTISFDECIHDESLHAASATQQLSVDSIFVLYNRDEQILRYAMSNSIGPISDGSADISRNPCYTGTHNCDTNAVCRAGSGNRFSCECSIGFRGDGNICYDIDECSEQLGLCGSNAVCNNQPGTYRCECVEGYQFGADGRTCVGVVKTKCQHEKEVALGSGGTFFQREIRVGQFIPQCDEHGNYVPTQCHGSTGYCWCVDRDGNEIDGTRSGPGVRPPCLSTAAPPVGIGPSVRPDAIPLPPGTHLLFAQSGKIEHVPLEGNNMKKNDAKALLHIPDKVIIGVAYDCMDKMVYWTDISGPSISRASLHGGEPTTIIRTDLGSPEGIALDHLGRNIFWTDSQLDRIEVARLDGRQRRILFDSGLVNPRAIVVDPVRGNLYWTDWNREAPKIETSYMDGTNRRILVKDDLGLPNGLTFDPYSSMLCWVDAGTKRLECMNPNQLGRRKIVEGIQYPFGVTSYGKNLYYTDWRRDAVIAVDRMISVENDNFQPHKRSRLYGITTAFAQCPGGHNYCTVNNGGCTHLCLATPGGRSCRCPDNTVGVDCIEGN